MSRNCPSCGYAFGGRVGDYMQHKAEGELDDLVEDEDDDEDERKAKRAAVHAGVDLARDAAGEAVGLAHGGRVPSFAERFATRRLLANSLARRGWSANR